MIDKEKIAFSFSRSAKTYDDVAYLQRDIGCALLEKIDNLDIDVNTIQQCLDLGCGTGYFQAALKKRFADAHHIVCDLAEGMLNYVKVEQKHKNLLCADAEALPIKDNSLDMIFSNLALQWCEKLDTVFAEAYRSLKPEGYFCLTTLGPKTLYELKASWAQVDKHEHVNQFQPFDHWLLHAKTQGFAIENAGQYHKVLSFDSLKQLSYDLKQLGAHNMNGGQAKALTGRQRWQQLQKAYQAYCTNNGQYPATYEVYYYLLKK